MEWMEFRGDYLPLMIIRRYLKLTYNFCLENNLLENKIETLYDMELPFNIKLIPTQFPAPIYLKLNIHN